MPVRTRDWLKFGTLVAIAFVFGLAFASTLNLPKKSGAAETLVVPPLSSQPAPAAPELSAPAIKSAGDFQDAFVAVAEHVKPSVVFIRSQHVERADDNQRLPPGFQDFFPNLRRRPQVEQGSGSGFIVSADGYILTNNHVVAGADKVTVRLYDKREFTAKVVGTDPNTDVAVIKIDARGLPGVAFGNSDSARVGEWVLAIGNPLGEAFAFTVTAGIVSAKGRLLAGLQQTRYAIQDFIQTDAAINPGNSGGPLVNIRGQVIGINSAIASETGFYAGYGFAIPMNLARTVMDQLVKTGRVERAVMGVAIHDARQEDADAVGLKQISGVVRVLFPLLTVHLTRDLGFDATGVGLVLGARNLVQQGAAPLGGSLSDRIGYKPVIVADPERGTARDLKEVRDRVLRQRHAAIARAHDAQTFGILVSKKIGQGRMDMALGLKALAEKHGRQASLFLMDLVAPDLLQGYRVDAWVNTACPRIAIEDVLQYKEPMLTPQEFEIVLGEREWTDYRFDEIRA